MHPADKLLLKGFAVVLRVNAGQSAGVQENHLFAALQPALFDHVNHAGKGLAGVAGVEDDGLLSGHEVNGLPHLAGLGLL